LTAATAPSLRPEARAHQRGQPFVQLRVGAVAEFCDHHQVGFLARSILRELVELAWPNWFDAADPTLRCSQASLAEYLGFAGGHGRRQVGDALRELEAAGAVSCQWRPGRDGSLTVTIFDQLVHSPTSTPRAPLHLVDAGTGPRAGGQGLDGPRADRQDSARRRADHQEQRATQEGETYKTPTNALVTEPVAPTGAGGGGGVLRQVENRVEAAVTVLAARERAVSQTAIRNLGGWERKVRERLRTELGEQLQELAGADSELTAAELADLVIPPVQPAASTRRLGPRPSAERCAECDDRHVIELFSPDSGYGPAIRCPLCCPPTAAAAAPTGASGGPATFGPKAIGLLFDTSVFPTANRPTTKEEVTA
jgi:hypothetical protein